MIWTSADERRVLAALPPAQVRAVRRTRQRAGELLRERGWVQGQEYAPGGFCISGALYAAAWELERAGAIAEAGISGSGIGEFAKRVISMELGLSWKPDCFCVLRGWNDQPDRRLADVLTALAGPDELRWILSLPMLVLGANRACKR